MRRLMIFSALLLLPVVSLAGTRVIGTGTTVKHAIDDGTQKAVALAARKGTCISRLPNLEHCSYDGKNKVWRCEGVVANHRGSCD